MEGEGRRFLLPEIGLNFIQVKIKIALGLKKLKQLLLPHLWLVCGYPGELCSVSWVYKGEFLHSALTEVMCYKIRLQNIKYVRKILLDISDVS